MNSLLAGFLIVLQMWANGLRLVPCDLHGIPALGRGRRSRPTRKMKRCVKLLGMCAESPASGACFVGRFWVKRTLLDFHGLRQEYQL